MLTATQGTAFLVVVFVFLVSILVVVVIMPDLPESVTDTTLCLPKGDDLSCGHHRTTLTDFLDKELNRTFHKIHNEEEEKEKSRKISLKAFLRQRYWAMKPAALFPSKDDIELKKDDKSKKSMVPVYGWSPDYEMADRGGYRRYGLDMVEGRMVVPITGVYFVYSSLELTLPSSDVRKNNASTTMRHSLFRYSYHSKLEEEILTSLTTPSLRGNSTVSKTRHSSITGLMSLKAGEEISTKVNDISQIQHPDRNYMGIFLV